MILVDEIRICMYDSAHWSSDVNDLIKKKFPDASVDIQLSNVSSSGYVVVIDLRPDEFLYGPLIMMSLFLCLAVIIIYWLVEQNLRSISLGGKFGFGLEIPDWFPVRLLWNSTIRV